MQKLIRYKKRGNLNAKGYDTGIKVMQYEGIPPYHLVQVEKGGLPGNYFQYDLLPNCNYTWIREDFIIKSIMETE